jgi:hypothetical protein
MNLDKIEQENLRLFLSTVYGPQVKSWPMNDSMFDLTYTLLQKSNKCSDLMDLVPRPMPPGQSAAKYITKQVKKTLLRTLKDRKQHYKTCVTAASWGMKMEFIKKANGL